MGRSEHRKAVQKAAQIGIDALRLGETRLEFELETQREVREVVQELAAQAQRSLLLHTEDLEPAIYDQNAFLEAVSRLARRHRHSCVWILIQDGRAAVQRGHRLIDLARRLSSTIRLHRPAPEHRDFHESLLLADDCGYLHRPIASRCEGTANFHDPGKATDWRKYFMEVWERSQPDEEIRRLFL